MTEKRDWKYEICVERCEEHHKGNAEEIGKCKRACGFKGMRG